MNVNFYIDGFNFYHSRLQKRREYRWLNILNLANNLTEIDEIIVNINFYTAYVSGKVDKEAVGKQQAYLAAIKTLPNVEIFAGKFALSNRWVKLVHPPDSRPEGYTWYEPYPEFVKASTAQEKGSDVKLGVHLVRDAFQNKFDRAYVLTNDTDLVEPVRITTEEIGKEVIIVPPIMPVTPKNPVPPIPFKQVSTDFKLITDDMLSSSQFPDEIKTHKGRILTRPISWR